MNDDQYNTLMARLDSIEERLKEILDWIFSGIPDEDEDDQEEENNDIKTFDD